MPPSRTLLATLATTLAVLVLPASALAWHANASIQCVYGQSPQVAATFTYGFPNGGPWEARERILQVNTTTDEWTPLPLDQALAGQSDKTYVWANGMNSNLQPATVTTPMPGNGGTFAAKVQWYGDDAGFAKSTIQTCVPPVPTCTGTTVPAGSPMPVCRPECNGQVTVIPPGTTPPNPVVCPPPPSVTPPATVSRPPAAATPPAPCVAGTYHLTVRKKGHRLVYRFRDRNGRAVRAAWSVNGRFVGYQTGLTLSGHALRRARSVAVSKASGCGARVRRTRVVPHPHRHHSPQFTG